jgi:catalase
MPLPNDEKVIALSNEMIQAFDTLFGLHPGFRPVHAKGTLLTGTFTPSAEGAALTRAPHVTRASTPVTVRLSNFTGLPLIPDNDPNANPRGMGIRFHLAEHSHTDIVAHSADGFPARTGQEFIDFINALAASDLAAPSNPAHPKPIEVFLGSHPAALAFVQMPMPAPSSFARENFFGLTALEFINQDGARQFGRYRIVPEAGAEHLDAETTKAKGADFLFEELKTRLASGPIGFRVMVQLANVGDVVDDTTIQWPADRMVVELGRISLTAAVADDAKEQKQIIFDPIPRVDGIEPSEDPLLEFRAAVYLISGRRRRAAQ